MIILEDKNQKKGKHEAKNRYFTESGIEVIQQRLPVGDYVLMNDKIKDVFARKEKRGNPVKMMDLLGTYDICIDSKNSIQELCGDICGKSHDRFRDELILAQNNGIKLVILVESDPEVILRGKTMQVTSPAIKELKDLHQWVNPRLFIRRGGKQLYPKATKGVSLMKACFTLQKKYGCEILFTESKNSGQRIVEILTGKENRDGRTVEETQ